MTKTTKISLGVVFLLLAGALLFWLVQPEPEAPVHVDEIPAPIAPIPDNLNEVIGHSVEGRDIESFTFGTGDTDILFVGGIHGGYEWNSIELAYEMIDYLDTDISVLPDNVKVHIIPNLNPDGLFAATGLEGEFTASSIPSNDMHTSGEGRFNANNVDLNRNFDCKWAPESSWRGQTVSAGTGAFSEPEAQALRDYVVKVSPEAVIFWHSKANNVYASECENGTLPETLALMSTYANASGYGAVPSFDAYPITGDAEGWLASLGIPAVTVEMGSRTDTEWNKNLAGTMAVLDRYGK